MFDTFFGLPMHPLVVHATVVVVPAAAISVALAALWPRFRAWASYLFLGLSLAALVLVPISTQSGESLRDGLPPNPLIERHEHLADGLLPWVIGLAVAAILLFAYHRLGRTQSSPATPRIVVAGLILIALVGAVGTSVQVARIGHSGAEAAWQGVK